MIDRLGDGRRFLAVLPRERGVLGAMERTEQVGRTGTVRFDGHVNCFDPA